MGLPFCRRTLPSPNYDASHWILKGLSTSKKDKVPESLISFINFLNDYSYSFFQCHSTSFFSNTLSGYVFVE